MPILTDGIRLARLKRSIGRQHAETEDGNRPLSPIEVARYMKEMQDDLSKESLQSSDTEIAKRLGNINKTTGEPNSTLVSDFLGMLERPSERYDLVWGWGTEKAVKLGLKIAWSMCRRLGQYYGKKIITDEDYGMMVSGILEGKIPTSDAIEILALKKKNPEKSFEDCCKEISNLVPEIITSTIFVADLDLDIITKINEKATNESKSVDEIIEPILSKYFEEDELEGFLLKSTYIKIQFSEKGRKKLDEVCKKEKRTTGSIVNHIFTKEGYGNE